MEDRIINKEFLDNIEFMLMYNPQIEMFQSFKTKSSFPQNETFI